MRLVEVVFAGDPHQQSIHWDPCTLSSWREKPRPALTRLLYRRVGHRTTGRSLSTGRGATVAALARRVSRRRCFRPGYNQRKSLTTVSYPNLPVAHRNFRHRNVTKARLDFCRSIVPGRNAREHGASSPCGSLYHRTVRNQFPQLQFGDHGSGNHSRLCGICWLCLIAYSIKNQHRVSIRSNRTRGRYGFEVLRLDPSPPDKSRDRERAYHGVGW